LGCLPVQDLKSTRNANQFWEQASKKHFHQKATIFFEMDKFLNDENYYLFLQAHQNYKFIFKPENVVNP
jgi:hypothetical protein